MSVLCSQSVTIAVYKRAAPGLLCDGDSQPVLRRPNPVRLAGRGSEHGDVEELLLDVQHLQHSRRLPGQLLQEGRLGQVRRRGVQLILPVGLSLPGGAGHPLLLAPRSLALP